MIPMFYHNLFSVRLLMYTIAAMVFNYHSAQLNIFSVFTSVYEGIVISVISNSCNYWGARDACRRM